MALKGIGQSTSPRDAAFGGGAIDVEIVNQASDYSPAAGGARGFIICTATGTVKIDTLGGTTGVVIPSGLATGVIHWIAFTKLYSTSNGTTATGVIAIG